MRTTRGPAMIRTLLATTAAVALMSGPALAQKQEAPAGRAESPAPAPKSMQNAPAEKMAPRGAASGHGTTENYKNSTTGQGGAGSSGGSHEPKAQGRAGSHEQKAQDRMAPEHRARQSDHRRGTTGQGAHEEPVTKSGPHQGRRGTTGEGSQSGERSSTRERSGSQMQREPSRGMNAQGKAEEHAGGSVSLTNEQKTKIRTTVIETGSAPKIERSQIHFSLNVGTVVPRSVKVVAVPPTLVEIHPEWRGYRYFVVDDEIIIVEPRTLRIVAVVVV
jgi:hypothetical protein